MVKRKCKKNPARKSTKKRSKSKQDSNNIGRPKQTELTTQQRKFCRLWVEKQNLADAWIGAGYKCKNRGIARTDACEFLRINPYAQAYIIELTKKQEERLEKNSDDVIKELIKIGFSNIQDYITENNQIIDISEIPRDLAAAIESIQVDTKFDNSNSDGYTEKVRLKTHNKLSALQELLDRWLGKAKQKMDISGVIGLRELTKEELIELIPEKVIPFENAIAT